MQPQEGYPREILDQPIADRVAYFQRYTMPHRKLREAAAKLIHSIRQPAGSSLIFVFGPSGVGKSTLLTKVSQELTKTALSEMDIDKGYIPIAGIEASAPEFSNFDWKDFYVRALQALREPMIEKKVNRTDSKLKLRLALESALKNRRPDAFFVDEAQNLGKIVSGRKLLDQTDCIKSLANISQTQFVLCGTYELLVLRNLSAQLCRRSTDIHLPRYYAESSDDQKAFQAVVKTFQSYLPLPDMPNLLEHWEFCYERSIGCVGILKDWLTRTLSAVLEESKDAKTLTIKDLEQHAWSTNQCLIMLKEAREKEKELEDTQETDNGLRNALGLNANTSLSGNPSSTATLAKNTEASTKSRKKSVGMPRPQRYVVGKESSGDQ